MALHDGVGEAAALLEGETGVGGGGHEPEEGKVLEDEAPGGVGRRPRRGEGPGEVGEEGGKQEETARVEGEEEEEEDEDEEKEEQEEEEEQEE